MKLSLRSEYALLSLIHIARQPNTISSSVSIGNSHEIPQETLNEILVVLINARYLRLAKGNCRLAKPAEKISVAEVIRLFDGALAPLEPISEKGYQPAPMEEEEKLASLFGELQEQITEKLENTTLADLI
jgi:Rrf2 family transcriptional regulator, cysteine metabolism repressor